MTNLDLVNLVDANLVRKLKAIGLVCPHLKDVLFFGRDLAKPKRRARQATPATAVDISQKDLEAALKGWPIVSH